MRIKGAILLVACFLYGSATTFSQQFPFVYYTPKDGLVNSRVRSIKQDSKGRIYFITYGGLSIYDGSKFTNYSQQDGLASELVNDVVEISPDSLLVATNAPSLNTLVQGRIGVCKTVDHFCPLINRFLKSGDGFWYAVGDDGLFRMADHRFIRLPVLDDHGANLGQNLDRITEWNNFFLIIPWNTEQREKLILYDKQKQKVTDVFTGERVFSTALNEKGELWVSTSEGIRLLDLVALQKGIIRLAPLPDLYHAGGLRNQFIFFDKTGTTWLFGEDRIITVSPELRQQTISAEQGLRTGSLADVFVDREGNAWMASDGNGAVKMTGTNIRVLNPFNKGGVPVIAAICQGWDTTWLFNATDNSVYRITGQGTRSFSLGPVKRKISNMYIRDQALYFTEATDLFRVGNKNLASAYRHAEDVFIGSSPVSEVGNGIVDPNGALIESIKKNETSFYLSVLYENKRCMQYKLSYAVDQMAMDQKGRLWAASRDDRLMVFTLHPEDPAHYLQMIQDYSKEIMGIGPRSLTIDKSGQVWIGTRYHGLYSLKFDGLQFRSIKQISTREGLTDNFIYRLYADGHNTIWAGTQTGLDKISLVNGRMVIENITKSKNIFRTIYTILAKGDNTIWAFASDGSILQVSETPPAMAPPPPGLLLTSLLVNDHAFSDSGKAWSSTHVYSYQENNFSFSVASPSFTDERSIRYSYLLNGSGKNDWSEASAEATFNFVDLPPGRYILNLKAEFPAARYPPQTLAWPFSIRPPYWRTWWFSLLSACLAVGMIYYIVRTYYLRILERRRVQFEKQKALEQERTRIAMDMHDDLGAGLSKIRFLSETVQRNISEKAHQPNLQNIADSSVELVDKFNEIIWAMNEKNNSLEDLMYYVRNYAAKYCAENDLEYQIDIPEIIPSVLVNGELRRQLFLTVKESLHNVVKHAEAKKVWLEIQLGPMIFLTIRDDGHGFEIGGMRNAGNGLRSMEERVKKMNGKLTIENRGGVLLRIVVPLG